MSQESPVKPVGLAVGVSRKALLSNSNLMTNSTKSLVN